LLAVVTGGAGFIGSNLVDKLLNDGNSVIVYDNFNTGKHEFLEGNKNNKNLKIIQGDLNDIDNLKKTITGSDIVFHLAANADVRFGLEKTDRDLQINTIGTYNVLEAMRLVGTKKIVFSSTSSVYGEAPIIPTLEDCPFPVQTSLYASSKLAGEALITSFCEGFGFEAWIYRFVSILGSRYTHGHIYDFVEQLIVDNKKLRVLGDGYQTKSYIDVKDCISGILTGLMKSKERINIFNLGSNESCTVRESIKCICDTMGLKPNITFSGGRQGWIGDNPIIRLDPRKINQLGWETKISLEKSIKNTVEWLMENQWCFNKDRVTK